MKRLFFIILSLLAVSCANKELASTDPCFGDSNIKAVVNWDDAATQSRPMRLTLFSHTAGVPDYDREQIDKSGVKFLTLPYGAIYQPVCYDYEAANVYFRNELDADKFEAYNVFSSRGTYTKYADPIPYQETVAEAGELYIHSWGDDRFDASPGEGETLVMNFYPKNVMREFTYRINNVKGSENIADARGAVSGMSSSYFVINGKLSDQPSTILFESATVYNENGGYITGRFFTFGPTEPYDNRFTIELISNANEYFSANWTVTDQISESMADRDAKLARDGYDILIVNDQLPEIPGGTQPGGSGFDIDVSEWNNVTVDL